MLRGPLLAVALVVLVALLALGRGPAAGELAPSTRSAPPATAGFSPYVPLRAYAWVEPQVVIAYCDAHELSPLSRREALKNVTT